MDCQNWIAVTDRHKHRHTERDRQTEADIRMFSFDVGMLLVSADSRQFADSLFNWCQHVLELTLLTQDEVQFLVKSRLINLHPFYVGVQLSDLTIQTHTHTHTHKHKLSVQSYMISYHRSLKVVKLLRHIYIHTGIHISRATF